MPALNTEVVNLFLEQFSRELPAGVHAVLIWDGAGFHTGLDLVVPSNVSLIQLPPYSPELNPVENLWHYLHATTGRMGSTPIMSVAGGGDGDLANGLHGPGEDPDDLTAPIWRGAHNSSDPYNARRQVPTVLGETPQ